MKSETTSPAPRRQWPLAITLIAVVLAVLFFKSFLPGYVHFSNDGPLGQQNTVCSQLTQGLSGSWNDINYIGFGTGASSPTVTVFLKGMLGPVGLSKFYAPIALFILGLGAWLFFNQLRFAPLAAILGALGVALNSAFFSTACWGVCSQQIADGFVFIALALVVGITPTMPFYVRWARVLLAGLAVGVNVMEAADIGALLSLMVAGFVCYHAWAATDGGPVARLSRGGVRVALIALFAMLIAAQSLTSLIGTQIKGVAGTQQDTKTKQERWDFVTQWSFPKRETLALVIPGLYGFRMDGGADPGSANYWGVGGRDPGWHRYFNDVLAPGQSVNLSFPAAPNLNSSQKIRPDGKLTVPSLGEVAVAGLTRYQLQQKLAELATRPEQQATVETPQGFMRQAGGGCYLGVTAVLLAFWAAFQSFRKQSVFTLTERRLIWFWVTALVVSLPLAYGRFAPFFQFVYAIPYASTVRNPGKFLSVFTFATTILAAFGIHGLYRSSLELPLSRANNWWAKATGFDRRWTIGCAVTLGLSLVGWFIYSRYEPALAQYLQEVGFDESMAPRIAAFSIRQVGWYVLFLTLGAGLITWIMNGGFAGRRTRTGVILLGLLLVADLGRANLPWIKHIDYVEKYASNPIVDFLRDKPYEKRVAILPFRAPPEFGLISDMYRIEWAQHHFPYYNIQSLDVIQMPRVPEDMAAFEGALVGDGTASTAYRICRRWELTSTRYLFGAAGFLDTLNQQLDPAKQRFRIAKSFDLVPRPGIAQPTRLEEITAVLNPNGAGRYAMFEFTGALPRAKLYAHWQVSTNDQATLNVLGSEAFDPAKSVLVAGGKTLTATNPASSANPGTVTYESYAPKDIKLKTQSDTATVLLLNDKYDPSWQVWVDGKRAELLRCNFIMRGVPVPAGAHTVEFLFKPDVGMIYVSLTAILIGIGLLIVVGFHAKSQRA